MKFLWHVIAPVLLASAATPAFGQTDAPPPSEEAAPVQEQAAPVSMPAETSATVPAAVSTGEQPTSEQSAAMVIPALTRVSVEIDATLGTKISKSGDTFPIRLTAPVVVDGVEAIPAGTSGMGEVVHAKKGGSMGAPGELVLAARYLDIDGQRLRLRSLHVTAVGKDRITESGVAVIAIGLVGLLVAGGDAIVPQGALAEAKTAEVFSLIKTAQSTPDPVAAAADGIAMQQGSPVSPQSNESQIENHREETQ